MKTYNDDGLTTAIVTVKTAIIRDLLKLPPYLGVELPNILRHLEKLAHIDQTLKEAADEEREWTHGTMFTLRPDRNFQGLGEGDQDKCPTCNARKQVGQIECEACAVKDLRMRLDALCPYCGHAKGSAPCQKAHP